MKKNKKFVGIVYSVKCKITGKFYVGATTSTLEQRKQDHEERAKRGEQNKFHEAISTYGVDAFDWIETDTATNSDELARKEKEHVAKFNSKKRGYNSDEGGGIKKTVYQYSIEDGSLINSFNCLESAASAVNAYKTSIGNACLGQNKTCKGYYWSYNLYESYNPKKDLRKKKVIQFSPSGKKIAVFQSVAEASRQTGISKTCISRVCRGERKMSHCFYWKYKKIP